MEDIMGRPKGALNKTTLAKLAPVHKPTTPLMKMDGWTNEMAGLGNFSKDKTIHTEYGSFTPLDEDSLANIYMGDGLASRIINCVADDMTREWIELDDDSEDETIEDEFLRLDAEGKFNEALRWQRLFGGSIMVIGAMDGRKSYQSLNPKGIRNIEYIKVFARTDIPISECVFDKDPMSETYGQILVYKINVVINDTWVSTYVHRSRTIAFHNDPIPPRIRSSVTPDERYWGMSSLQPIYESIRDLGGINQSISNLMYEFLVGKYKFDGLAEMLAEGHEGSLIKRVELINLTKSMINGVILGEGEEYTRDYATLAGLPEVVDRFMLGLSGSTGIPVTRLFGRSPAGLNATGENDLRNYYDLIEANQRNKLKMPVRRLITLLAEWKKIDPPKFEFNSLYQMTETEKSVYDKTYAETEKLKAETAQIYVEMQARAPEEVRDEMEWGKTDLPMLGEIETENTIAAAPVAPVVEEVVKKPEVKSE
jgi:phage-related protein (TIGR01555 family)